MKSMFQEASSIQKAVEKAWEGAGRPQEFSIKVLETEVKNFWGMTTKPAIVSISYNLKKTVKKRSFPKKRENVVDKPKQKKARVGFVSDVKENKKILKDVNPKAETRTKKPVPQKKEQPVAWNKDLINDATTWIKEMTGFMVDNVNVDIKIDQRILNINLDKKILRDGDDEKLFFISLSHLLMQFLRKKHKRKFINYYLIIHTKSTANDESKQNKPNNQRR